MVINGDTIFFIDFNKLLKTHLKNDALITLSLKNLANFDRYGTVEIDQNLKIAGFNEKRKCVQGLINGGVYMINKEKFEQLNLPEKFSLEKEVLENKEMIGQLYAEVYEDYFIDIGIPEDFLKANIDLA
jgi:D-glycero-alpha-D-manno-heptose 1-phosphate guanylyltransferase